MKNALIILLALIASISSAADKTNPHRMGWKPSPHGVKGFPIETHPLFKAAPLPPTASVAQWYFETNQDDRGACVAFSIWEATSGVFAKNNNGAKLLLSPLGIYQDCLKEDGNFPNDDGTYGTTGIKVMLTRGAMLEKTWPYSKPLNKMAPVNSTTKAERSKYRAIKAYRVENNDNGFATKQCIANIKIGVPVGTYWYGNQFDATKANVHTKDSKGRDMVVTRYVLPMPKGRPVGGHEVVIISYDDNMVFADGNKGGVEIHNHWSAPHWGSSIGSAWAPYAWFFNPKYAEDKVAIELLK